MKHLIVYFEDDVLYDTSLKDVVRIDAAMGMKYFNDKLERVLDEKDEGVIRIYTNNPLILMPQYNELTWNEEEGCFTICLRCKKAKAWKYIQCFSDRELKIGHNLLKLYTSDEFLCVRDV